MIRTENNQEEYNNYYREYMRRWYIKRKLEAIAYKGGKCRKCGYDKCYAALSFHHRDPSQKELDWSKMKCRAWTTVLAELDKCDLLCNRCHTEEHHDTGIAIEAMTWLATHEKPKRRVVTGKCEQCGVKFIKKHNTAGKFCSRECHARSRTKADYPPDHEFVELVNAFGRVKVGKQFGVSDKAIAKRYRRIKNDCARTHR